MPGDTYHIIASDDAFVNVGDSYQSVENKRATLFNCLLPNSQSNKSLALYWDHEQARQKHVGKTGQWLHDSAEFKSWIHEPNSFIWLHGIAGCGKTVLSSTVVDHLRDSLTGSNYIACYYLNAREDEKRNVSRLLRSLLLQLCPTKGDWPPKVEELYNKCLSQEFSDDHLFRGLEDLIERDGQTYIIVDALDECDTSFRSGEKSEVEKLADFFLRLTKIKTSNLHLLVTSRDGGLASHVDQALSDIVQKGTEKGICQHTISLETKKMRGKIDKDIREFVEFELRRWNDRKGQLWLPLSKERKELIANSVKERANGMFRLAACLLDLLWRKRTWDDLKAALNDLPPELPEVYNWIFKDIKSRGQMETASILIRWLLYSERPLSLEELTEVTMSDLDGASFNPEMGTAEGSYVSLTLSSFVTISRDNLVHFAHQTVRDYLLSETTEEGFYTGTENCQEFVTKCCLSYMQFCGQSDLKRRSAHGTMERSPKEYKLLEYAVNNWYKHALRAWSDSTTTNTLDRPGHSTKEATSPEGTTHRSTLSVEDSLGRIDDILETEIAPRPLLDWAASVKLWLNLTARMESDLYRDALKAIACKGYEKVVGLLIPTEISIASPREDSQLNILTAALAGRYSEMILLILEGDGAREQNDSPWWPQKPGPKAEMHIITYKSHDAIVRLVVEQAVDINLEDSNGWTALHTAAFQGHETIVRLLLGKGVNIHIKDSNGQTPLHIAASQGHEVVTRLLLDEGADVDSKDKVGWTALDMAVQKAVMDFFPQDTQSDTEYSGSRTAPQAVQGNHKTLARTIRSLLERKPGVQENCDREILEPVLCTNRSSLDTEPDIEENRDGEISEPVDEGPPNSVEMFQGQDMHIFGDNAKIAMWLAKDIEVHGGTSSFIASVVGSLVQYGGSVNLVMSSAKDIVVHGGTSSFVTLLVGDLVLHGGSVSFAMSLIEELLVYGWFPSFARLLPAGTLRLYRWSINFATTHFKAVIIYKGTANFATSYVRCLVVSGGSATFSSTAQIRDMVAHGGSLTFLAKAQIGSAVVNRGFTNFSSTTDIKDLVVNGGCLTSLSTAQIKDMVLNRGSANFSATARIKYVVVNGGSLTFSSTAQIEEVVVNGGSLFFSSTTQIKYIVVNGGSLTFSSTAQIEDVVVNGGCLTSLSTAQIKDMVLNRGSATFSATARIKYVVVNGGSLTFSSTSRIEEVVVNRGTLNFIHQIHREIMRLLLREEVDVESGNEYESSTVQVRQLVVHGGSLNILTNGSIREVQNSGGVINLDVGITALHLALRCGHEAIAALLLENGTDPNANFPPGSKHLQFGGLGLDNIGWTALHEAACQGHEAIVHLLLENKADIYIKDVNGQTALQLAALRGHMAIVRLLEEKELDIGRKDKMGRKGQMMLHKAIERMFNTFFSF